MKVYVPGFPRTALLLHRAAAAIALTGFVVAHPGLAAESTYPQKPIRVIVTAPPGGGTDQVTRMIGTRFQQLTGQPWVIDNRGGANGMIGTELLTKAPPDGYTLAMVYVSHAVNPSLYKKVPYDTLKDFEPITQVTAQSLVMAVHPSLPVKTVRQLIALAKSKPGEINYGSSGSGTGPHLAMELFRAKAGIDINHVPYKGGGPVTSAVMAGEVPLALITPPPAIPQVRAGRLRAIAVTGTQRIRLLPDTPTIAEAAIPGFEASTWYGLLAPAGTPKALVEKVHEIVVRILDAQDIKETLALQGVDTVGSSPEEFGRYIASEMTKWRDVIRMSGAHAD